MPTTSDSPTQGAVDAASLTTGDDRELGETAHGTVLGRYILLEVLGRGGMGVVYAAYDPELDRRVALKLLGNAASETARARLVREAQAMARVSHPNVISVHDVGQFRDNVFVAMELVDGEDLRTWLRAKKRSWSEVLPPFLAAGRGLAAAHEAGLVHRDFKPANVLRSRTGEIRVVDFGLARMSKNALSKSGPIDVDAPSTGPVAMFSSDVELTRTGALMGTPAYMAPEQHVRGEVDGRTDQFGFCVALYEALYGVRPFSGDNRMALMFEVGSGTVPPPPKGSTAPMRLHRALVRGLRPEPDDRWPSMDALLAELARAPPITPARVVFGGLALGIVGGAAWLGAGYDAKDAPCNGARARLVDVWDDGRREAVGAAFAATALPYQARANEWIGQRLDEWSDAWVTEHQDACAATAIRAEQSEALLDLRMLCLESQRRDVAALVDLLSDADDALVERAPKAIAGLPEVAACSDPQRLSDATPLPTDEAARAAIAEVEVQLSRARALDVAGRYEPGLALTKVAVHSARELEYTPLLARALSQHGTLQASAGDKQAAVETLHEAATAATAARADHLLAVTWTKLVWHVGLNQSRHEDALRWARYARAALERAHADGATMADLEHNVGTVLWAAGRLDEALPALQSALALRQEADPDGLLVAHTLTTIGNVEIRRGQSALALEALTRAKKIGLAVHGPTHPLLATIDNAIGVAHYHLHDLAAAAAAYERAYATLLQALGPDHPDLLFSLGNIGTIQREQGKLAEALETMLRVRALVTKAYPAVHRESGMTEHNIGEVLREMERPDDALARYNKALEIREQVYGPDDRYVASTLTGLGETLLDLERAPQALAHLERALVIREASEEDPREVARTRMAVARALATNDDPAQAARARALAMAARDALAKIDSDVARRERAAADVLITTLGP